MFRLTREVRFALNAAPDEQLAGPTTNSFGGFPALNGWGEFLVVRVTLAGQLDPGSGYLRNIKDVDNAVRQQLIPLLRGGRTSIFVEPVRMLDAVQPVLSGIVVERVDLLLSPFLTVTAHASEKPMVSLSQKFEFSASHRLHSPRMSEAENQRCYGKCNNPNGHGHNYELQVTLRGRPDTSGVLIDIPRFERVVQEAVIERFDHKNLNVELPEFLDLIPSVENIAMVIYRLLKPALATDRAELASVTVWETAKTWCEYSE